MHASLLVQRDYVVRDHDENTVEKLNLMGHQAQIRVMSDRQEKMYRSIFGDLPNHPIIQFHGHGTGRYHGVFDLESISTSDTDDLLFSRDAPATFLKKVAESADSF